MSSVKKKVKKLLLREFYYPIVVQQRLRKQVNGVKSKDKITIAFITMNIAMWKCQGLYDLLRSNERFRLYIVISPSVKFDKDVRIRDAKIMREYFSERNMPYVDWDIEHGMEPEDIKTTINPDILFFTQPGKKVFTKEHSYQHFRDKLLCYIPYGFYMHRNEHMYNREFQNIAWKLYYFTTTQQHLARIYGLNKGRNVVVVGYPSFDQYTKESFTDVWKIKDNSLKRIVWAPHFTITKSLIEGFKPRSTFLLLHDMMLRIACQYEDKIQIAFKPHPRLLTELYNNPDWGKQRADEYYERWRNMKNGQLETGDFINLFYFSDALIHDSSSFVVDYIYFKKPELFLTDNIDDYIQESDEVAQEIYQNIYHGVSEDEICQFIDNVVLSGNDPLYKYRLNILKEHLLPPNGKTSSENIYNDLCRSLAISI